MISGSKRRNKRKDGMSETVKKKVLTVGDGDLSLSLALSRAYGEHHIDFDPARDHNSEKLINWFTEDYTKKG